MMMLLDWFYSLFRINCQNFLHNSLAINSSQKERSQTVESFIQSQHCGTPYPPAKLSQFQPTAPPEDDDDSLLRQLSLATWNSFSSKFRIFTLKPEASSALNHRFPNWNKKVKTNVTSLGNDYTKTSNKINYKKKKKVPLQGLSSSAFLGPLQWSAP